MLDTKIFLGGVAAILAILVFTEVAGVTAVNNTIRKFHEPQQAGGPGGYAPPGVTYPGNPPPAPGNQDNRAPGWYYHPGPSQTTRSRTECQFNDIQGNQYDGLTFALECDHTRNVTPPTP